MLCEIGEEQALRGGGRVEALGDAVVARVHPQIIQILEPLAEKYQQEDREIAAGGKCCVIQ